MKTAYIFVLRNQASGFITGSRWALIILKLMLVAVVIVLQTPFWWAVAGILALLSAIEWRAATVSPRITFSSDNITFHGFWNKKYSWPEIENVVLKDGLLTVDFTNNRLFQKEVEEQLPEPQFNEWCKEKISGLKG